LSKENIDSSVYIFKNFDKLGQMRSFRQIDFFTGNNEEEVLPLK
tara:strand:+ start:15915 stop:16046 length:132 start_codon:yes stop_codon:yes gene_type:complete